MSRKFCGPLTYAVVVVTEIFVDLAFEFLTNLFSTEGNLAHQCLNFSKSSGSRRGTGGPRTGTGGPRRGTGGPFVKEAC